MKNCSKMNEVNRLMGHLESGLGRVSGNASSGDTLLLPTRTLSLAVGASQDSVMRRDSAPASGPSGGPASPRKLGASKGERRWV